MPVYTPPALTAVNFALTEQPAHSVVPAYNVLTTYTIPALTAVNFAIVTYVIPVYNRINFELLSAVVTYYGILKRWTGSAWVKEPLKTYLAGTWQSKPLKRWNGSAWVTVDTTGV